MKTAMIDVAGETNEETMATSKAITGCRSKQASHLEDMINSTTKHPGSVLHDRPEPTTKAIRPSESTEIQRQRTRTLSSTRVAAAQMTKTIETGPKTAAETRL